jgi:uncharacterized protein YjbJ (UPF0337 family)
MALTPTGGQRSAANSSRGIFRNASGSRWLAPSLLFSVNGAFCKGRETDGKETVMNWDIVAGQWKQFKGKLMQRWGKLTDDRLAVIAGKREQVAGRIQQGYGAAERAFEQQLKAFKKSSRGQAQFTH